MLEFCKTINFTTDQLLFAKLDQPDDLRARVSALFRSSLTGRIRTRVRKVDLGGYLLLLLRQGQGHAYRHDKQLTGDLETYYAR